MQKNQIIKYDISFFRNFAIAKYFVILGFLFSTFLLNSFHFSPFFLDFFVFKILIWNLFLFSLFFFLMAIIFFFFLFRKEINSKDLYKKNLKWIFSIIFLTMVVNLIFLLKGNSVIATETFVLFFIFFPIQIVFMFVGISLTIKFFSDWQKSFSNKRNT